MACNTNLWFPKGNMLGVEVVEDAVWMLMRRANAMLWSNIHPSGNRIYRWEDDGQTPELACGWCLCTGVHLEMGMSSWVVGNGKISWRILHRRHEDHVQHILSMTQYDCSSQNLFWVIQSLTLAKYAADGLALNETPIWGKISVRNSETAHFQGVICQITDASFLSGPRC